MGQVVVKDIGGHWGQCGLEGRAWTRLAERPRAESEPAVTFTFCSLPKGP